MDVLAHLYSGLSRTQGIVYCNSRKKVDYLTRKFKRMGLDITSLHGDMRLTVREQAMHAFRSGTVRMLFTTDFLARNLDIQQVALVVNYDVPRNAESYFFRVGRSKQLQLGKRPTAVTLVTEPKMTKLKELEMALDIQLEEMCLNVSELQTPY
eukprot:Platyproteum_vivax@DN6213_c0_g1_i4.p1